MDKDYLANKDNLENKAREILTGWSGMSWDGVSLEKYLSIRGLMDFPNSSMRSFLDSARLYPRDLNFRDRIDRDVYLRLKRLYGVEYSEIGTWFGVWASTVGEWSLRKGGSWTGKRINEVELYHLLQMIQENRFEYNDSYLSIRIFNRPFNKRPSVLVIDGFEIKFFEDEEIPERALDLIMEKGLNRVLTRNPIEYYYKFFDMFYDRLMKHVSKVDGKLMVDLSLDQNLDRDLTKFFLARKVSKKDIDMNIGYFIYRMNKLELVPRSESELSLLEQIVTIDGQMKNTQALVNRVDRSLELSSKLKKLYNYRCQLCREGGEIPPIPHKDGKQEYYVEMHHLIPISDRDYSHREDVNLDAAWNSIVVCCYHHKVLHYHRDLYEGKVTYDYEQDYFFIGSKGGSRLRVVLDKHFRKLDALVLRG